MNAGYSSGWCEQSFGMPLTAVEVTCKAKGDEKCTFIMSPPHRIQEHVERYTNQTQQLLGTKIQYDIPTFFERKKVEEEMQNARTKAEESDKAKSEFLANMSHEIRTPMNAIIGYVDLMLQDQVSKEHRGYLDTLKESGNLLLKLINDILDVSKIEAGQLVVEQSPFSLKELFDITESTFSGVIAKNGSQIQLIKSFPEEGIANQIYGDSVRIQQVLYNLIGNAIKFTKQGTVQFSAQLRDSNTLCITVKDSGIGIDEKDQLKIFEMFGQADASTTRLYGGTGLGLTISKKLVELMGGQILIKSVKGNGSEFSFTLPYIPLGIIENELTSEDEIVTKKDCLLLVEDNLINQRLTKLILEKAGFEVLTADKGQIGIDMYMSIPKIKLILMDIQMPVLDGLLATQAIRQHELEAKLKRKPIVALTAHAMKGDKEKCLNAGCDNYLSKPIVIETLLSTIKSHL